MHVDLSPHLHTEECNILIRELKTCFNDNKFMKFLFACDQLEIKVEKCLRRERIKRQLAANERADIMNAEIKRRVTARTD